MNQKLLLVILAVSLIPAFMSFGRGITGMAISDTAAVAEPAAQSHPFLSGIVLIYVLITIVVLAIATSYLISIYSKKPSKISPHAHFSKSLENIKLAFKSSFKSAKVTKSIHFAKISDDKAAQYIVGVVALVGLVAILIMIL
jgi:hypothetical protein